MACVSLVFVHSGLDASQVNPSSSTSPLDDDAPSANPRESQLFMLENPHYISPQHSSQIVSARSSAALPNGDMLSSFIQYACGSGTFDRRAQKTMYLQFLQNQMSFIKETS